MSSRRPREVLSPIVTTPNIPQRSKGASPYGSPPARLPSNSSPSTLLMEQQDDELERKARRRSRVMDLQRRNLTSSPSSPADRRKSLPLSGLTTAQLTDHYTSCIKLSAENKINAKNAFGLHLIDFMSELLMKKELENFQVASTTLDASAKIYAGRVDAIHAETYKVLSGLGRTSDKQKNTEDGDDAEPGEGVEGEDTEEKQKKKKKTRKSKTVETNLKNLNVNKFELEFEVDPLFTVMSAAFDEGGSSGLLLNNLRTFDNSQQLVLDSNTVISTTDDLDTSRIEERRENVDLSDLKESFTRIKPPEMQVCPAFSTFRFTNWDATEQNSVPGLSASQADHRFDIEAEPEPIPNSQGNMSVMGAGDGSYIDDMVEDVADTNLDDDEEEGVDRCIGDGKAAQLVQNVLSDMAHGTTGTLMQVLSTEPSDYSYFNKALLRTWAGPDHWRSGNVSKGLQKSTLMQKSKTKKQVFRIDFDEEIDLDARFRPSKFTALTKNTLNKYSKDQTTLPKDHHYDADTLFRLFLMKRKMIRRQASSADVDDVVENYDYENVNDRENYCPNDEVDDDNDSGEMDFGDFGSKEMEDSQESSSQDPFCQSQDPFTQNLTGNETVLGDKLLAQPYKVNKIDIDYAKTAKKLDVKRLKSSMWTLLKTAPKDDQQPSTSDSTPEQEENANNSALLPGTSVQREMDGKITFQKLLTELPEKVSGQTARNLSVPIAFVCLLHLANEKTLKIEDINMEDLLITQGL